MREADGYRDRLAFIREKYGDNLTLVQAAEYLKRDKRTVKKMIEKRIIKARNVGTARRRCFIIPATSLANFF